MWFGGLCLTTWRVTSSIHADTNFNQYLIMVKRKTSKYHTRRKHRESERKKRQAINNKSHAWITIDVIKVFG